MFAQHSALNCWILQWGLPSIQYCRDRFVIFGILYRYRITFTITNTNSSLTAKFSSSWIFMFFHIIANKRINKNRNIEFTQLIYKMLYSTMSTYVNLQKVLDFLIYLLVSLSCSAAVLLVVFPHRPEEETKLECTYI